MSDTITLVGNVGGAPEMRSGSGGTGFTTFRVASNQGYYDRTNGQWVTQGTNWYNVSAFYELGSNVYNSLKSGDAVIVHGTLKVRTWEKEGTEMSSLDVRADHVGVSLAHGTAAYTRARRESATATQTDADAWAKPGVEVAAGEQEGAETPLDAQPLLEGAPF